MTSQLFNLSLHQSYKGHDDIVIGDGSDLQITHTGSMSHSPFTLNNVLYVPTIHQNFIYFSKKFRSNKASIEFFPSYFLVKDLRIGKPLL